MNPCPCGFLGDPRRACGCDAHERRRYTRKLSGPLLDRIDLRVAMAAVPWKDLGAGGAGEGSDAIRERVRRARVVASARGSGAPGFRNADLSAQEVVQHTALDRAGRRILETAVTRLQLSVRALHRALRVARTIADLDEADRVTAPHLAEALSFRHTGRTEPSPCPVDQVDSLAAGT
jgi:magnesium chelatase family protein